ncbi:PTS lactose/cellobiose transporter subunit IIA [Salipaludibacillus agaradhaerens]|jgi:PTS system cellobiose-specific IIA component|uniref:PTS lactose/cellobiose transporter subunit IIA n=1 Tax=Salipaludibacillus agaradhaerens TaxID=76935 RepID=A0A9Q4AZ51_SALAG|nr:PTS lactose/cellobiose transporter subunit IIA [Salipaludibacillus agaradhaerens]MCR6095097.1 PTS lactose/cellobiose transporter subunit IIA [Salipaludibacillus agaradhaerens]MCR6115345.1 PTS lactose/cellobiose transporter subunit IIA [Salipaludibacillus agaradhaerens]
MNTANQKSLEEISFQIILHAGNARSSAMEAVQFAREGKFEDAKRKMEEADQEFYHAHHFQTNLLQKESSGERVDPSILLIHAQDHLMTSMATKDLVHEMLFLHEKLQTRGESL